MTGDFPAHGTDLADGYQVRVKGYLSEDLLAWLDLSGIYDQTLDETLLWVATTDQAVLYGLFNRLCDLGLTLISVRLDPLPRSRLGIGAGGFDDCV
jgi:hypothetical protein